jgi:hypothetical protein
MHVSSALHDDMPFIHFIFFPLFAFSRLGFEHSMKVCKVKQLNKSNWRIYVDMSLPSVMTLNNSGKFLETCVLFMRFFAFAFVCLLLWFLFI